MKAFPLWHWTTQGMFSDRRTKRYSTADAQKDRWYVDLTDHERIVAEKDAVIEQLNTQMQGILEICIKHTLDSGAIIFDYNDNGELCLYQKAVES